MTNSSMRLLAGAAGLAMLLGGAAAQAQEVTLRALSTFGKGTFFAKNYDRFIAKVNAEGKGVLQINLIGGPEAIPAMEGGSALRNGVVDMLNSGGAFYTNVLPEADFTKLLQTSQAEQRRNGGWAYINRLHNEKMNAWYLARQHTNIPFYLYINKPLEKADLTGMKLRVTPVYRTFFAALGATTLTTAPGEVYSALERGTVDGYGWPALGIFDLGWADKTKYRVEPSFYATEVNVLVNLNRWKSLTDAQRDLLSRNALWLEGLDAENEKLIADEFKRQEAAGIKVIRFTGAEEKKWLDAAYGSAWEAATKQNPDVAAKLRPLLGR